MQSFIRPIKAIKQLERFDQIKHSEFISKIIEESNNNKKLRVVFIAQIGNDQKH